MTWYNILKRKSKESDEHDKNQIKNEIDTGNEKKYKKFKLGIFQPDTNAEITGTVAMLLSKDSEHVITDDEKNLKRNKKGIILHPQPRNDPNDPLNWPKWQRDVTLLVVGFHSLVGGGMTPILAAGFGQLSQQFDVSLHTVSYLVGVYMLFLGIGSLFAAPTALLYGKRFVYLLGQVIFIVTCIWAACSKSFGVLLGARIVMGFGVSPVESLPSSTIAEIYFQHERAYRIGIYTLLLIGGKNLVPLVSAFVIGTKGWQWVFWIVAMVVGMNFVLTFFFVPESFWDRTPIPNERSQEESEAAEAMHKVMQHSLSSQENNLNIPNHISNPSSCFNNSDTLVSSAVNTEKSTSVSEQNIPINEKLTSNPAEQNDNNNDNENNTKHLQSANEIDRYPTNNNSDPLEYSVSHPLHNLSRTITTSSSENPKKPYYKKLAVFSGRHTNDWWIMVFFRPFVLLLYPPVLFATFLYAFSVVWLIMLSEALSQIFSVAPYHFSPQIIGLLYVSPFVGGFIGTAVAGKISDAITRYMIKKNDGVYEPEFRLIMVIFVGLGISIGLMGFGWSSYEGNLWIVPTIFFGILSFGCCLGSTTAVTYTIDCYRIFAAEGLVSLNLMKNVLGFCFSLFNNTFITKNGAKDVFVVYGCIEIFLCLLAIPLYIYGKRIRHWTDNQYFMKYLFKDT